jgi:hypothetical protein
VIGELAVGLTAGGLVLGTGLVGWREVRRRGMHRWLLPYLLSAGKRRAVRPGEPVDLILAVCDHYEPKRGGATMEKARARVQQWVDDYPRLFDRFRDAEGKPPQYSFFYPADEYEPELVDMVAGLCRRGYGEVEIHLHHDNDTADSLRNTLLEFKHTLRNRHGLLGTDSRTGETVYGFIHGNWALDNARCDGRWCGVNNELDVLRETGCYADFTLPSAPSETQTRKINSIYWAVDDPTRPKSHNTGTDVGVGDTPKNGLLMIQGPLLMDWSRRKWGIFPGVENSCLQANQPPDTVRLANWLKSPSWRALPPQLAFCETPHARRVGAEPGRAPRRADGAVPRSVAGADGGGPELPGPLRHRPRDGQPGTGAERGSPAHPGGSEFALLGPGRVTTHEEVAR